MYRFYLAAIDMLPGAALLIPIYFILNQIYFRNSRKSILYFLFSCYLSVVYVLVGLPNVTYIRPELNLNLIPFAGMLADLKNSILNVLLFIPLGIMLPLLWNKFKTLKCTLLFGFGISLAIELLQTLTFRATDVNDLITNTFGALFGFLCAKVLLQSFPSTKGIADNAKIKDLLLLLMIMLTVMFFLYPFISAALWDLLLS